MLSKVDLNKKMDKKSFNAAMKELEPRLKALQQRLKELDIPLLIVFEGWSASGKSTHIGKLVYPLDPRDFAVRTTDAITEDRLLRPWLWRFARYAPAKGRIAIFDKSWHRLALPGGVSKWQLTEKEIAGFWDDAAAFERCLIDDGVIIVKFFLHISKEEQKKRFVSLEVNEDTKWRVDELDWKQNKEYNRYVKLFDDMIRRSDFEDAPWTIIEAEDRKYAAHKMLTKLADVMEKAAQTAESAGEAQSQKKKRQKVDKPVSPLTLADIDLSKEIGDIEYKEKLKYYQAEISRLGYALYAKRVPVVIVYEGWDAAGKGGAIKRLTQELDPRGYNVVPVPAPSPEELSHNYLWRFWTKIPKDGHIAIFDRSWYGRVMVERVEGFCAEDEWRRAYREINAFESHLVNHGVVLIKFWLHVDKDEQLARFTARQADTLKQYKITDEDWRNRDKWDLYELAVNEMLARTDTEYAPWSVVESNDKRFARVRVLEHVCSVVERSLLLK